MELQNTIYPLSRYWYSGDIRFYYAYGNTPAQDFLQNITSEKEPSILVLGCGDIRSCFYSLWKNFDVKGQARFDGVHFILNDISAAVLARNILFLYLCIQMPEEEAAVRKWLCGMWAIWYCHELHQDHYDMLNDSLKALCSFSEAWSDKSNPLYSLVKFVSHTTRNEIKTIWKTWLDHSVGFLSVEKMLSSRLAKLMRHGWVFNREEYASEFVEGSTEIPFENDGNFDARKKQSMKSEVLSYSQSGSVFAEEVLGLEVPSTKTFVNTTFYEKKDGTYTLHYNTMPFSCFYQTVQFTKKQLHALNHSSFVKLLVKDDNFALKPFLANSVQQFSLWLQSSHYVLRSKLKLKFTFDASHALTMCYEMENNKKLCPVRRFDMIYSSNLMDHLTPPNLILSAIPLLKESGLLFTTTLYKKGVSTLEKYLNLSFGFDCKFFPLILGVRCINHEGENYASPVTVKPCPLSIKGDRYIYKENVLVWEKLPSGTLPLVLSDQPLTNDLANALFRFIQISVYPLLKTSELFQMINCLCVETAVKVIQAFMHATFTNFNPDFWRPLCSLMQEGIKPYLNCMQTQLFLHGIHMHLTVCEDCPVCLQAPLSDYIGLFTIEFFLKESCQTPTFMAIVHKEVVDNAEVLCSLANSGGNVHVFDCVSPSDGSDNFLQLYFYAPLKLVQEDYKVTIIASNLSSIGNLSSNRMNLPTQPLSSLLISFKSFKFFRASALDANALQLQHFGTVTSHISNGDSSDVEISVLPQVLSGNHKLQSASVSSTAIQLSCGRHKCQLNYPYPIAYDCISIKLKRKDSFMSIQCPRTFHKFEEEKPLFIISPDKEFSLSPYFLAKDAIVTLCGQQFTMHEREIMDATNRDISKMPPLARVKESILVFFST